MVSFRLNNMRLLLFITIALSISLSACKKDNQQIYDPNFVGSWKVVSADVEIYKDHFLDYVYACNDCGTFDFYNDGTGTRRGQLWNENIDWFRSGAYLTMRYYNASGLVEENYTIQGESESYLYLYLLRYYTEYDPGFGMDVDYEQRVTLELEKY